MPTFSSVPVGSLSHYSPEEIMENLSTALPKVVSKVPFDGWQNIQNIEIKTGKSASLPVWNCDLDSRWVGVPDAEMLESPEISEAESEAEEVAPTKAPVTTATKTKEASKKTKSSTQVENKRADKAGKVAATSAAKVSGEKKEREKKEKTAAKSKK